MTDSVQNPFIPDFRPYIPAGNRDIPAIPW
jgi:hypothetical protein